MTMRKRMLALLTAAMMVIGLVGCGGQTGETNDNGGGSGDGADKIVFKIAHLDAEEAPSHQMLLDVKEYVEKETNGKVEIQIYPNGILGSDREVLEGIQLGTIQMSNMGSSVMSSYGDKFAIFEVPFLYNGFDAICEAYDGQLGEVYNGWLAEEDFTCMGILTYGWKGLSNNVRTVKTPGDIKGLKIRVMEVPMFINTFKALGANPTAMSWNEIYTGLQQGTIEGQDNSPELTYTSKFYEVQKYYTNLNHVQGNGLLIAKKSYIESLPENVQKALQDGFAKVIDEQRERSVKDEQTYIKNMQNAGIEYTELTDEERQAFADLVKPVHDEFRKVVGDEIFDLALSYSEE